MPADDYCFSHTTPPDKILDAVERWAHLHTVQPQMVCGPYEGRLLTMLASMLDARLAVEFGTFVGYSAICIARGLSEDGVLHTFEVNDEYQEAITNHINSAGVSSKVQLHIGDAAVLFPRLMLQSPQKIDLAFIDAGKRQLRDHYEMVLPFMRSGGIVVVDNVLWGGKVLDADSLHDADTRGINAFNDFVRNDQRVENVMLNVRDGLLLCRVL